MTIKNINFPVILKCIQCNKPHLEYQKEGHQLVCNHCKQPYPVSENVPVLIPDGINSFGTKSELHQASGTAFNYIDHYQKDAHLSDYFEQRDAGTEHSERRVREYISTKIPKKEGVILDVGCGKAWVAELYCPVGFEVVSMDISLLNTSKALKLYPYTNHHALVADVFSLPFTDNTFDYIIASEIIEHVHDPGAFIKNLFAILKPGGRLIITTPYKEKLQYALCIHCNKPTPLHAHINTFDEKVLKSLYAGSDVGKWSSVTFGNKVLFHLRTHILLKYLPFNAWRIIDTLFDKVYNAPSRIMVVWEKNY